MPLQDHPIAAIFPLMPLEDLNALAFDIKANGQAVPIVLFEGKILDGRNRYRACLEVGVEPEISQFRGDDALSFVISHNLHRRHLTESQRAMVAANLANMSQGERTDVSEPSANLPKVAQPVAAKMLNVSTRSVGEAKSIAKKSPELAAKVESGELSLNAAKKQLAPPKAPEPETHPVESAPTETTTSATDPAPAKDPGDSDNLAELKYWWLRSTKDDRRTFTRWILETHEP